MQYRYIYLQLLMIAFLISCSDNQEIIEEPLEIEKINGISLALTNDPISLNNITPLQNVNTSYVSLIPFGFISDLNNPEIEYNTSWQWLGETTEGIKQYAETLKGEQIEILIKPQIWVSGGVFTGTIELKTEEEWLVLEESYENYILEFAMVAEEVNAKIFCIGTELEKFVINRPDFWLSLITKIKTVYTGKLTYAANWDEFERVNFWNELDYIGVDAYFPLSTLNTPTVEDLKQGWIPYKQEIETVQMQFQKPILFTEFGYRSINFGAQEPWDSTEIVGEINLLNQSNALQVLFNEFWVEEWFAGGFLWKWFLNHENAGGENNNRFTVQNKPAENIIKLNYEQFN